MSDISEVASRALDEPSENSDVGVLQKDTDRIRDVASSSFTLTSMGLSDVC